MPGGILVVALLLTATRTATMAAEPNSAQTLAGYRDKNRVLVVFAPSEKDANYLAQQRLWEGEKAGFADRDLVVLPVFVASDQQQAATLAKKLGVAAASGRFAVVLVGKDGNAVYQSERPVKAEDLYARIDAMPMRRDEVRRKAKGGAGG